MTIKPEEKSRFVHNNRTKNISYEEIITDIYKNLSQNWTEGYMIDGGAYTGLHAFRISPYDCIKKIYAFEANPKTAKTFKSRLEQLPDKQKITLIESAIQDDPNRTEIEFHASPTHPGRSGINPILRGANNTNFDNPNVVQATTLDKECGDEDLKCVFIKLDLEGGEYAAMRGGASIIEKNQPLMVFENGKHAPAKNNYTPEEFIEFLNNKGMTVITAFGEIADSENLSDFWYAWACNSEDKDKIAHQIYESAKEYM